MNVLYNSFDDANDYSTISSTVVDDALSPCLAEASTTIVSTV